MAEWGGVTLLEADDGPSGLAIARRDVPDIVVLNLALPGMSGYEVANRLKNSPGLRHVPVVALTALNGPGDRERALAAGCDGYIPKPVHAKRFACQLQGYIEGKSEALAPEEERWILREISNLFADRLEAKFRELAQAQECLEESRQLSSKFIALAAHELRTPLTIVHGYLGILLDALQEGRPDNQAESLEVARGLKRGVQRLSDVVDRIIDIARLEANVLQLNLAESSVGAIVRTAVNDLRPAIEARRQQVHVAPFDDLPRVRLDPQRIYQVFMNVLENAIKYTPDGGQINVTASVISAEAVPRHQDFTPQTSFLVDVAVQDSGIGIAAEDIERIFYCFYEARDSSLHSTSKYQFLGGGTGLGLAMARGIVRKHGGWLWAESPGCDLEKCPGSCFHIALPVRSI